MKYRLVSKYGPAERAGRWNDAENLHLPQQFGARFTTRAPSAGCSRQIPGLGQLAALQSALCVHQLAALQSALCVHQLAALQSALCVHQLAALQSALCVHQLAALQSALCMHALFRLPASADGI